MADQPRSFDPGAVSADRGQSDNPEEDWGEATAGETVFSSNHTRRPIRTEAERGQGAKTRQLNKDIVSRRT
jgi:hypothetical protein